MLLEPSEAAVTAAMQYLCDQDLMLPVSVVRGMLKAVVADAEGRVIENVDQARAAAQVVAEALSDPKYADRPWLDPVNNRAAIEGLRR